MSERVGLGFDGMSTASRERARMLGHELKRAAWLFASTVRKSGASHSGRLLGEPGTIRRWDWVTAGPGGLPCQAQSM